MTTPRLDTDAHRVFRRGPFTVEPFNGSSQLIWERRQHVVCGISPGNSYFRAARLTDLLAWLCAEFAQVDVVIPDSALEHTYHALGFDPQRAAKKTRGEINVLCNRVARAWKSAGGPRPADGLHRMSDLTSGAVYREKLAECEQALHEDGVLWRTCAEMSREVLAAKGHDGPLDTARIERAMRYLTAELPFFMASSDIFGVPSSLNFYHRRLPLAELLFSGHALIQPSPRQAYATIRPAQ
ncbi:tRNA-dependent cyclodipeptide synthase [Streptomyces sp. G44]|uniref:tRNA-dependent cyclodipeptide synthase n=1 Tax=Streptomyces sp. G44 TaxID=2807632 RepID=UPI001961E8CE|nr:tRNA-dependent cyclodipeptide synthase [Streptomyces sp. G44]MBM7167716.1 tRNA-dependent cyclodipeptide synthase [Streptomyces sp. G44]